MKRIIVVILIISLILLSIVGCTGRDEIYISQEPTAVAEPTPEPTLSSSPTPTQKSLIEEAEDTARRDRNLEDRIEAVEYLLENDLEQGLSSGNEVITSINFRSDDFWEFLSEETDAPNRFLAILTVLADKGHMDTIRTMADNLHSAVEFWEGHEEQDIVMRLLKQEEWFKLLTVPLSESGWFDDIVFAEKELQIRINLFISHEDIDDSLLSIQYLNKNISPSLANIFNSHDGIVIYPELGAYEHFEESLPILSTDLKSENLEHARFLMVLRDLKPSMDSPSVYVNLGWQTFIPEEYSPGSIDDVTHIVLIDTTYEYYATYGNKTTKAYKSNSIVNVYNFKTGELVVKTNSVATSLAPSNITYSGSAPEAKYASINTNKIFMIFYEEILGIIE